MAKVKDFIKDQTTITLIDFDGKFISASDVDRDFHAFINESDVDLEPDIEEQIACFYMKNWRKMSNSILEVLDETGFLDK